MIYAERLDLLRRIMGGCDGALVAFSGGVDSAVLLHTAVEVLGSRAMGVIADSPSLPRAELVAARDLARLMGARLVEVRTDELEDDAYSANRVDRCYHCKRTLFAAMEHVARRERIGTLVFGEIVEDLSDDRPGARAALESQVLAPLSAAGFTKHDVRRLAREAGLPVWDKPSSACLASRIPTGTPVTRSLLAQVERAEEALRELGLRELRVRHWGPRARLEVGPEDWELAQRLRSQLETRLMEAGFAEMELARYVPGHLRAQPLPADT